MKRLKRLCSGALAGCLALALLLGGVPALAQQPPADETVQATLRGRGFKAPEDMGVAASQAVATSAVFGMYDGRSYAYSTANGGMFNAIDVDTNRLVYSQQLGDVTQVWTHAVAPDGTVYISGLGSGNVGELWVYDPAAQKAERAGVLLEGHQAWSSTTDPDGNLYVGTFQEGNAHVVKYEAATGQITDLGKVDGTDNSGYVRSLAYHGGALYMGMGVMAKVMRMDLATREVTDITGNAPALIGKPQAQLKFAYDMAVAGNYLLVRMDADYEDALLFYDLTTGQWADKVLKKPAEQGSYGAWGFTQLAVDGDDVYVIYNRKLLRIDLATLDAFDTGIAYASALRGAWMQEKDGARFLLTVSRAGEICWFDLAAGTVTKKDSAMMAAPLQLHNLGLGNNGRLYMTTYPGGPKGSEFDPVAGTFRMYNQGQAEGIAAGEGSTQYFGLYPGAVIQKMDTDTGALTSLFSLKETYQQDRPYIMTFAEGKLFVGTIPDYQKLGGALAVYDPSTDTFSAWRNVVQDQSIVGLAVRDGLLYGSTTIRGGLDIEPTATQPKLFIWDIAAGQKLAELTLDIPGLSAPMISGLTFDSEGNLWGAADGVLFTFDTATRTVSHYENLYPGTQGRGMWRPVHILFGDDGLLYTDIAGKLTVVDPATEHWDHVTLSTGGGEVDFIQLAFDADGNQNIYYLDSGATHLKMIPVIDGGQVEAPPKTSYIPIPVQNPGFEEYAVSPAGWTPLSDTGVCTVSTDAAADGTRSLYVESSADGTAGFVSGLIGVSPGVTYDARAQVRPVQGASGLVLQFLDADGTVLAEQATAATDAFGEWQNVTVSLVAPESAVSARLLAQCQPGGAAFFDSFGLSCAAQVDTSELLPNGDFETDMAGWSITNQAEPDKAYCELSSEQAKTGTQSLKFLDGGNPASCYVMSDPITAITPGQAYKLRLSVYNDAVGVDGGPSRCSVIVRYYASDSADTALPGEAVQHISATGAWQDVELNSTAPAGAVCARVWLGISPYYVTSGSYFDALSFTADTTSSTPGTVELTVPNASCEESTATIPGWNRFGDVTASAFYTVSDERAHEGSVSLKFTDQSSDETVFIMSDSITLPAGLTRCTAGAKLYLQDGACSFLIRFYNANGQQVGTDKDGVNIIPVTTPSPEWQEVQTTVDIPAGAVNAVIGMGVSRAYMTTGAFFDSVTLAYPIDLYTLTVVNGEGGGDYEAGTAVTIRANAAPAGRAFDHWVVSGKGTVASSTSAETTFTMGAGHATVRAVFRDISSSSSQNSSSSSSGSSSSGGSSGTPSSSESSSGSSGTSSSAGTSSTPVGGGGTSSAGTSGTSSGQVSSVSPQTGDEFPVHLLLLPVIICIAGLAFIFLRKSWRAD